MFFKYKLLGQNRAFHPPLTQKSISSLASEYTINNTSTSLHNHQDPSNKPAACDFDNLNTSNSHDATKSNTKTDDNNNVTSISSNTVPTYLSNFDYWKATLTTDKKLFDIICLHATKTWKNLDNRNRYILKNHNIPITYVHNL